MILCEMCGAGIDEDDVIECPDCGARLCPNCVVGGFCTNCVGNEM